MFKLKKAYVLKKGKWDRKTDKGIRYERLYLILRHSSIYGYQDKVFPLPICYMRKEETRLDKLYSGQ